MDVQNSNVQNHFANPPMNHGPQQQQPVYQQPQNNQSYPMPPQTKGHFSGGGFIGKPTPSPKRSMTLGITLIVTTLIVSGTLIGLVLKRDGFFVKNAETNLQNNVLGVSVDNNYQGVFLTNGQVYFGHVISKNSEELQMTNVYYLMVNETSPEKINTFEGDKETTVDVNKTQETASPDLTLVKRINALHKPEDLMILNMQHVIAIENLAPDSQVVEAIKSLGAKK